MNARFFACGTSFTAHSGREDCSLRARRHTFRTPFRRSQLHCSPTHEATSGAVSLAGKGESVKATSPPLCKGSFHWRLNALPHTPETSSPDKFPFRRLSFHCVAGVSNTFRAMPTQRPTHIDSTPTPDVRTADTLTPFRLSVNRSTRSAFCRSRWTLPTPHTHFSRYSVALRPSEKCSPASGVSEATLTDNADLPPLL